MVELSSVRFHGRDLNRPECVVATANGRVYVSDFRGGVSIIEPDGEQSTIISRETSFALKPNGIQLERSGSFLIAHLGPEEGGVFRLLGDGVLQPVLLEVDGQSLPPTNFVYADETGRLWITVSTRLRPRAHAYRADNRDGFIVCVDRTGHARIVADQLGYTNECAIHPDGAHLYVNETFTRELSRYRITSTGHLTAREVVLTFDEGEFPDGLAFDEEGWIWVVCVISNRVIRVSPDGIRQTLIEDTNRDHVESVERAYRAKELGAGDLQRTQSAVLRNVSSIAFGGPARRRAYLGSLLNTALPYFVSPVAGYRPHHWDYPGPERHESSK